MNFCTWQIYLPLQTEGCILSCVPCTKLSTTWPTSHPILLYLRLYQHTFHLVLALCTYQLFFLALLYLRLYPTGTHFQSQLFQVPPLQLLNTHLQCIICTKQLYFLISRVQLILAMLFCTHAYAKLLLKNYTSIYIGGFRAGTWRNVNW